MFINIDEDYYLKYYNNYEQEKKDYEILSPREGLTLGNLFYNLYDQYKHYKPRELKVRTEKEQLLLKIQELSFAVNDLNLYLDIYPNDEKVFHLFKKYVIELNKLNTIYAERFDAIEITQDLGTSFTWYNHPWPWEVMD